jgi:hypothetical protein
MAFTENVGTYVLSADTLTIVASMGVTSVSVLLVSGTVTVSGSLSLGARTSDPITLSSGTPLNVSFQFPIDGYVIDASAGEALIIVGR